MALFWIWLLGSLVYGLFLAWYINWRGPLTPAEVEKFKERLKRQASDTLTYDTMVSFMETDDGRGFVMLNLIKFPSGHIDHPVTSQPIRGQALIQEYFKPFANQILGRAGHPVFQGPIRGGYIEAWGVEPNPGWQAVGIIRYRSRRDILELITTDAFNAVHGYKKAALLKTSAMPMQIQANLFATPPIWFGMLVLIICLSMTIMAITA